MITTRGTAVRRRVWTTVAVAFSIFCSIMTATIAGSSGNVPPVLVGIGFVLGAAGGISLVWRRQRPWAVLAITLVGPLFFPTDATAALIALFAVARIARGNQLAVAGAVVYVACGISLTYDAFRDREFSVLTIGTAAPKDGTELAQYDLALWIPWLVAAVMVAVVVALSLLVRTKTELVEAEHVRDLATEQTDAIRDEMIRTEERTRIARDMHDTIAASLSRISLFAGGLQVSAADNPEKVVNTAVMIRTTAHEALDELKGIVGVLRGGGDRREHGGHQGIDAIGDLVNGARAAGIHCRLESELLPGDVGMLAGHVCYRVVQEALTNVQKYASDQMLVISVTGSPHDGIRILARNKLSDLPPMTSIGSRSGLRGLAEQAREIGGKVEAGALGEDFLVSCWVPWFA
ncbi:sensor histidine kinase [Rhodococcus globerulus]|uniref:histidine kinase n=1 Tax=Rhodococcus globerulus TaxID=33008 RepID=A0ABU4BWH2_RHOGO|nr:histidine kinase [Rhodococcus globerulus]MDV6268588.1 histidine kinase [Rhodococcus globerulus]